MKNQKICIIGDGLAGLTTALAVKKLDLDIELYIGASRPNKKIDQRITAISESNFNFIKDNLPISSLKFFWPCKKINLFYENKNKHINFLNFEEKKKNLMYIFENNLLKKEIFKRLKSKNIKIIKKQVNSININEGALLIDKKKFFYDAIILCLGPNSKMYDNIFDNRNIKKDYSEVAVTCKVKHNIGLKNPTQYFLKEGPLALLPYKNNYLSIVWSLATKTFNMEKNRLNSFIGKKLENLMGGKQKYVISEVQSFPIKLNLQNKYYKKNILVLGEGIHSIHPMAGQGFNLVIRDIKKLYELLKNNITLGLSLKNSFLFEKFYTSRKPENILFGLGVDLTNSFFRKNKILDPLKTIVIKNLKNFEQIKKISKSISDNGLI